jgi:ketosteroid isomerase-like protein
MADPDSPLGLCIRYRDAFFARDVDALMALVTPDFVFENATGGERIEGVDAARRHIAATHPDTGRAIEWDGIDLIQVRDGRICRNAVYSSAHAARVLDQPA